MSHEWPSPVATVLSKSNETETESKTVPHEVPKISKLILILCAVPDFYCNIRIFSPP
jgi:hypothetical protein